VPSKRDIAPVLRPLATVLKILLFVLLSPLLLLGAVFSALFGGAREGNAEEAATCLRGFLDGDPGPRDWDDFTSSRYRDPGLDSIRWRAAAVDLPLDEEGEAILRALMAEAEALARPEAAAKEPTPEAGQS
jgi:hypothetical protein